MITAVVQFQLPENANSESIKADFVHIAPMFQPIPGLIRKYFLLSEDCKTGGGVYLWESRQQAEAEAIAEKFGSIPSITYFETPAVVDNLSQAIL